MNTTPYGVLQARESALSRQIAAKRVALQNTYAELDAGRGSKADLARRIQLDNTELARLLAQRDQLTAEIKAQRETDIPPPIGNIDGASHWGDDGSIVALKSADRLADLVRNPSTAAEDVGLGRWLRAYLSGDWDGMPAAVKAMSVSSAGAIVPTPTAARVIDYARNAGRIFQAGALTIPMEHSTLKLPRLLGDAAGEWKAENDEVQSESALSFDTVTLTAKTLVSIATMSVELVEDSDPRGDAIVERSMGEALALTLDAAALYGDANDVDAPDGLYATAAVPHIDTSAGHAADYRDFVEAVRLVRKGNFEPAACIWSPDAAAAFDGLRDTTGQPLRGPASFTDLLKLPTNQASADDIFIGDFSHLAVGMRTALTIEASRDAATGTGNAFSRLQVKVRAYLRADVAVLQPRAFAILTQVAGS